MMKNRVKDLNIKIDLSVLNDIKDTLIQNLSKTDFSKNTDYDSDGYCKVIIYDGISPFIFDDFDEISEYTRDYINDAEFNETSGIDPYWDKHILMPNASGLKKLNK